MADASDQSIGTRHSLLGRLKDWADQESWRDFFNSYWKLIYSAALKSGLSDAEAQEVVQETVLSVSRKMKEFKYDPALGSFRGWLLQLTRWRIIDQVRKRRPEVPAGGAASAGSSQTSPMDRVPDPKSVDLDAVWNAEWKLNLMDAAIERVKRQVNARHFQVFDLFVLRKWPARKVAEALGINLAQVYIIKQRVSAQVRKQAIILETKLM